MVSIQTESAESVSSLLQRKHLCMWSSEEGGGQMSRTNVVFLAHGKPF